jgi:hypothetical protein
VRPTNHGVAPALATRAGTPPHLPWRAWTVLSWSVAPEPGRPPSRCTSQPSLVSNMSSSTSCGGDRAGSTSTPAGSRSAFAIGSTASLDGWSMGTTWGRAVAWRGAPRTRWSGSTCRDGSRCGVPCCGPPVVSWEDRHSGTATARVSDASGRARCRRSGSGGRAMAINSPAWLPSLRPGTSRSCDCGLPGTFGGGCRRSRSSADLHPAIGAGWLKPRGESADHPPGPRSALRYVLTSPGNRPLWCTTSSATSSSAP